MSDLSVLISAITLIVTVSYYYRAVIHMEQSQEANLFNTLHTEYSQDEMNSAFQTIEKFQYMHPTESIEERACVYALEKVKHSEVGSTVDHARRRIVYWYQKLVHFHQFGLLPEKYFTVFPGPDRVKHFLQDIEPLAFASCGIYGNVNCTIPFDYLRRLYSLPPREFQHISCPGVTTFLLNKTTSSSSVMKSKQRQNRNIQMSKEEL